MLQTRYYFTNEFNRFIPILEQYPHETVFFRKKDYLKPPGDIFRYNYLIIDGFCKVSVIHASGEEKIIGYWGPGSIYPIICTEQAFLLETSIVVTAMTPMTAWRYNTAVTKTYIYDHPDISYEMIDHYGKFTNLLFFCTAAQTYEDLKIRLCSMLLICRQNLKSSEIPLSQAELASMIGAKRESVVKILKELRENEIIATTHSRIHILSIKKLEKLSSLLLQ